MNCGVCANTWTTDYCYCPQCGAPVGTDTRIPWRTKLAISSAVALAVAGFIAFFLSSCSPGLTNSDKAALASIDAQIAQTAQQLAACSEEQHRLLRQIGDAQFDPPLQRQLQDKFDYSVRRGNDLAQTNYNLAARKLAILHRQITAKIK